MSQINQVQDGTFCHFFASTIPRLLCKSNANYGMDSKQHFFGTLHNKVYQRTPSYLIRIHIPSSQINQIQCGTFCHFFASTIPRFLYKSNPNYCMGSRRGCIHIGTGNSSVYGTFFHFCRNFFVATHHEFFKAISCKKITCSIPICIFRLYWC